MPHVIKVKSLFKMCLKSITSSINYWCNQVGSKVLVDDAGTITSEERINPFEQLSSLVLEEIVAYLRRIGNKQIASLSNRLTPYDNHILTYCYGIVYLDAVLKTNVLECLITEQLINLDLGHQNVVDVYRLLETASARCKNLKNLKLEFTLNFNCIDFFPQLENLVVLNISNSKANNIWLESIGAYCIHLRELSVQNCKAVTDAGIEGLFLSSLDITQRVNFCKSIQVLSLLSTGVSNKGIRMTLLKCPALRVLIHYTLVDVLIENAQKALLDVEDIPIYSLSLLTDFILSKPLRTVGSLELALSLCPLVTKVKIEFITRFSNNDLLCLKSLKKLSELKINCYNLYEFSHHITFNGGVDPLLLEIGNSLEILSLSFISGINVWLIAESCPNLRSLTLNGNVDYTIFAERPRMHKIPILKELVELHLIGAASYRNPYYYGTGLTFPHPIPKKDLVLLLSSPLIFSLSISGCDTLTDEVLLNASKLHQFQNLNRLTIAYSNSLTSKGLCVFLQDTNPLKKLVLKSESTEEKMIFTQEFCKYALTQAKQKNLDFVAGGIHSSRLPETMMIHDCPDDPRWCYARKNSSPHFYP